MKVIEPRPDQESWNLVEIDINWWRNKNGACDYLLLLLPSERQTWFKSKWAMVKGQWIWCVRGSWSHHVYFLLVRSSMDMQRKWRGIVAWLGQREYWRSKNPNTIIGRRPPPWSKISTAACKRGLEKFHQEQQDDDSLARPCQAGGIHDDRLRLNSPPLRPSSPSFYMLWPDTLYPPPCLKQINNRP